MYQLRLSILGLYIFGGICILSLNSCMKKNQEPSSPAVPEPVETPADSSAIQNPSPEDSSSHPIAHVKSKPSKTKTSNHDQVGDEPPIMVGGEPLNEQIKGTQGFKKGSKSEDKDHLSKNHTLSSQTTHTLGGIREPKLVREQLNQNYLPKESRLKMSAQEQKRLIPLKEVDLDARVQNGMEEIAQDDALQCGSLELIEEVLLFSLVEQLNQWGVNVELSNFTQDSRLDLSKHLKVAQHQKSHLKVKLFGSGQGVYCIQNQQVTITGQIELKVDSLGTLFKGSAMETARDDSSEFDSKQKDLLVQSLVSAWRDHLIDPLKDCLIQSSKAHKKGTLKIDKMLSNQMQTSTSACFVQ